MVHKASHILIALSVVITIATGIGFVLGKSSKPAVCSDDMEGCLDDRYTKSDSTISPTTETESNLKNFSNQYGDNTISTMPPFPLSVRYTLEHRSALNGQTIGLQGTVLMNYVKDIGCTTQFCFTTSQPHIVIKDANTEDLYTLNILTDGIDPEIQKQYSKGDRIEIKGTVNGNTASVEINALAMSAKPPSIAPTKQPSPDSYGKGLILVSFVSTNDQAISVLNKYNLSYEPASLNNQQPECQRMDSAVYCPPTKSPQEAVWLLFYVKVPEGKEVEWVDILNKDPLINSAELNAIAQQQ